MLTKVKSGLGAGISATAFMRHSLSTTIVEIDPAVYDAASTFFGLPDPGPGKLFLEDARSWAAQKRANVKAGNNETLYDIVIHDCFSGGGVPEHIFTMEFWEDLEAVIQPEGVVVVVSILGQPMPIMMTTPLNRTLRVSCNPTLQKWLSKQWRRILVNAALSTTFLESSQMKSMELILLIW